MIKSMLLVLAASAMVLIWTHIFNLWQGRELNVHVGRNVVVLERSWPVACDRTYIYELSYEQK